MKRIRRASIVALLAALAASAGVAGDGRPNLLLFLVDDLGWQDVSLALHDEQTEQNRRYRTPNLERLAQQGVRFTNAYAASPVCTPTRTAILTGAHPARTRITNWTLRGDRSAQHPKLLPPDWNWNGLAAADGEPHSIHLATLPELLRAAGYRTIHVGKAHFGAIGTSGADPRRLGFDINIAGHASGAPGSFLAENGYSGQHRRGSPDWDVPGLERHAKQGKYLTEALTDEAVDALRSSFEAEQPFFLYFSPYAVHTPIEANPRYVERYLEAGLPPVEAAYASMIESVDTALGTLLDLLESEGELENTLVIFFSDNGGLSAHGRAGEVHVHNAPLRSGKGSAYEGGTRVPLVIRRAGAARDGTQCDVPVHAVDLFPTLLAAAQVPPSVVPAGLDGMDLAPLFTGAGVAGTGPGHERNLYWHYPHQWGAPGPGIHPYSAVRSGRWKLIYFYADAHVELYDLVADLGETIDLAASERDVATALQAELGAWLGSVDAQAPRDKVTGESVALP